LALYGIGRSKQVVEQDFIGARKSQRSRNADVEGGVLGNLQTARAKSWQESTSRGGTLVRIKTLPRTTTENQIDPKEPCYAVVQVYLPGWRSLWSVFLWDLSPCIPV